MNFQQMSKEALIAELEALEAVQSWLVFDRAGVVRNASRGAARMLGVALEDVLGRPFDTWLDEGDVPAFSSHLANVLEGEATAAQQLRLKAKNDVVLVRLESRAVDEVDGRFTAVRAIVVEIATRWHIGEQLLHAQKMEAIGRLAGGVAHELNNVLTVITGYSDVIQRGLRPEDPMRAKADEIGRAADRAAALVRQLLVLSRKRVFAPQALNLSAVVADMTSMLRRLVSDEIELDFRLEPRLRAVKADPAQIEQAVMNLVMNARDAIQGPGRITIETDNVELDEAYTRRRHGVSPGSFAAIEVRDTGVGMVPTVQAHVFEPFFTTKPVGTGTGLGLSTVYGIVNQTGGHIDVVSAPGRGSTFTLYFPTIDETVESATAMGVQAGAGGRVPTILVVENEEAVRKLLREVLSSEGYHVLEAAHAWQALHLCEKYEGAIDLVVADAVLPQVAGQELARRLAARSPAIPVLLTSSTTEGKVPAQDDRPPTFELLPKPFAASAFLSRVREMLRG